MSYSDQVLKIIRRIQSERKFIANPKELRSFGPKIVPLKRISMESPRMTSDRQNCASKCEFSEQWKVIMRSVELVLSGSPNCELNRSLMAVKPIIQSQKRDFPELTAIFDLIAASFFSRLCRESTLNGIVDAWSQIMIDVQKFSMLFNALQNSSDFHTFFLNFMAAKETKVPAIHAVSGSISKAIDDYRHNPDKGIISSLRKCDDMLNIFSVDEEKALSELIAKTSFEFAREQIAPRTSFTVQDIKSYVNKEAAIEAEINFELVPEPNFILTKLFFDSLDLPLIISSLPQDESDENLHIFGEILQDLKPQIQPTVIFQAAKIISSFMERPSITLALLVICDLISANKIIEPLMPALKAQVNLLPDQSAFLLASFCHERLQNCPKDFPIQSVLRYYVHLQSFDSFLSYYIRFLAIRLLSYDDEIPKEELAFVEAFSHICQNEDSGSLKEMLSDIEKSRNSDFNAGLLFSYSINLLSKSAWPQLPLFEFPNPSQIAFARIDYTAYFKRKNQHRKIEWADSLETCIVQCNEVSIHCFSSQFYVLNSIATFIDLGSLKLDQKLVKEILTTLLKTGLIKFAAERYFIADLSKIKSPVFLPTPSYLIPQQEGEKDSNEAEKMNKTILEAGIVKYVKAHNHSSRESVLEKIGQTFNFAVSESMMETVVEDLLNKQYLSEDGNKDLVY